MEGLLSQVRVACATLLDRHQYPLPAARCPLLALQLELLQCGAMRGCGRAVPESWHPCSATNLTYLSYQLDLSSGGIFGGASEHVAFVTQQKQSTLRRRKQRDKTRLDGMSSPCIPPTIPTKHSNTPVVVNSTNCMNIDKQPWHLSDSWSCF